MTQSLNFTQTNSHSHHCNKLQMRKSCNFTCFWSVFETKVIIKNPFKPDPKSGKIHALFLLNAVQVGTQFKFDFFSVSCLPISSSVIFFNGFKCKISTCLWKPLLNSGLFWCWDLLLRWMFVILCLDEQNFRSGFRSWSFLRVL